MRDASKLRQNTHKRPIEVVEGPFQDPAVLAAAFRDATGIYLSLGNFPGQEDMELGIVHAAKLAGVRKIVKLSGPSAGPSSPVAIARMHGRIEAAIKACGFDHVFLRPYAFFQNLANQVAPLAHFHGLFGSTGSAALNMFDARDVGAVAARTMLTSYWDGKVIELTGDEAVTYTEIAERLSAISGETYLFFKRSPEVYLAELLRQGLPEWTAEHVIEIQAMTRSRSEAPNSNTRDILGRPARTLTDYLPELLSAVARVRDIAETQTNTRQTGFAANLTLGRPN
ncbi:NmrA family NAD(P)-binding protein [Nitratireductor aquimarinus]|uniref:NmrA family NAD(P)-binding protein n=1 Tax=Nitratireductor TaxID=245876 RepID=UPI001CD6EC37|nr:NmrA family NAD(P)-binding protein [Nitratireductor aquimarinus]MCA1259471.1 NmrA family NAD(P)-binding protein [Nitratireductor aquimarinus]